jgi:3-oxoacyl-[acyl-carrier protein] reductase
MIPMDLSGKTAVVTGASQGIGACTALRLAEAGANVAVGYLGDPGGVNRARAEETVRRIGGPAFAEEADVRNPDAVAAMFDRCLDRFGNVEIVVSNAGINRDRTIGKMSVDEWREVIETNLTGTFNVCREAALRLADGGRIVTLSSLSALVGLFGQSNYAASKAGVIGLTRVLSRELAKRAITVNAVAPGVVLTEMGRSIPELIRERMLQSIPLGRFGEPREVADAVLFLCSDHASYITGQTIQVNGGWVG